MNILINDVMDQKKISIYKMAKDTFSDHKSI